MSTQKLTSQWYRLVAGVVLAFAMIGNNVLAANRIWDPAMSGTGVSDGDGYWATSPATLTNWWNGTANVAWVNANKDTAIFGNGGAAGTVTLTNAITTGDLVFSNTASGTYTLTGNTLTLGNTTSNQIVCYQPGTIASAITASGPVFKTGSGLLTLSSTNTFSGTTTVSGGTLTFGSASTNTLTGAVTLSGSSNLLTLNVNGPTLINNSITIGNAAGDRAVLNISTNVTLAANNTLKIAATTNTAAGAVYQTGGTFTANGNGECYVAAYGYGYYKITGGIFSPYTLCIADERLDGGSATGVLDIRGGIVRVRNELRIMRPRAPTAPGDQNLINVFDGGLLDSSLAVNNLTFVQQASTANSVINISGTGSAWDAGAKTLSQANNGGATTVINVNDGGLFTEGLLNVNGFVTLNFNGGILRAGLDNSALISGAAAARVYAGGATLDTQGYTIPLSYPLTAPTGNGVSAIAVTDGGSGYIGSPVVKITGGTGSGATAIANMTDDGTGKGTFKVDSITVTCPGVYTVNPTTVSLIGGGATTAGTLGAITTAANTSGGLTKQGNGILNLSGANTYTGETRVKAGTLKIGGTQTSTSGITLSTNVVLDLTSSLAIKTLTLGEAVTDSVTVNLMAGTTTNKITVNTSGGLNAVAGTNNIKLAVGNGGGWVIGTKYPLINYSGSIAGTGFDGFALAPSSAAYGSLVNDANVVNFQVSSLPAVGPYIYTGAVDGNWDFATLNFTGAGAVPTLFANGGAVTFDDTVAVNTNVVLTTTLTPSSVTVNNSTKNYLFSGLGKLTGAMSLTKSGTATLTIGNTTANDFLGGINFNGGILKLGSATVLPTVGTNTFNGGALDLNGFSPTLANITGTSGTITNSGATQTLTLNSASGKFNYGGTLIGSTLSLAKSGVYTQVLSSVGNSFNALMPGNNTAGGVFSLDNSLVPNPTLTLSGGINTFRNDGGTSPARFTMNAGTLTLGNDFRLSQDGNHSISTISGGTVNQTGGQVQVGFNSGMAVFNLGSNVVYNASGRNLVLGTAWACNSFVNLYGNANAIFGGIYLADSNGVGGSSQYGTMNISENATLTASSLSIGGTCNNATAAVYGQYNQSGGTVTINGNIMLANTQSSGTLLGSLNLAGGTLKAQKISGGTGMARLNFHGGTFAYTNTVGQADLIALGSTGAAYIYEGITIDTANHSVTNKQPLLNPTGSGVINIAITAGGVNQFVPPSVKIVRNAADTTGVGATAIAQVNPITGVMTNILITNPGTDYTLPPTVTLDRGQGTLATLGTVSMGANSYTGGLTKIGSGMLTLTATNTYIGATIVSNGTLRLTHAQCLSANTAVSIVASAPNNAKVELDFTGTNTIQSLTINGKLQLKNKVYNISNLPEALTGNVNAFLYTTGGATPPGTMIQFK